MNTQKKKDDDVVVTDKYEIRAYQETNKASLWNTLIAAFLGFVVAFLISYFLAV